MFSIFIYQTLKTMKNILITRHINKVLNNELEKIYLNGCIFLCRGPIVLFVGEEWLMDFIVLFERCQLNNIRQLKLFFQKESWKRIWMLRGIHWNTGFSFIYSAFIKITTGGKLNKPKEVIYVFLQKTISPFRYSA